MLFYNDLIRHDELDLICNCTSRQCDIVLVVCSGRRLSQWSGGCTVQKGVLPDVAEIDINLTPMHASYLRAATSCMVDNLFGRVSTQ